MTQTEKQDRFPIALLNASGDTRRDYFLNKTIDHPHLERARDALMDATDCASATDIIILTGPTGVGKTTLGKEFEEHILETRHQEMKQDPNFLPVVRLSAVAPNQTGFCWKDFYVRLLRLLDKTQVSQRTLPLFDYYPPINLPRERAASSCPDPALQRAIETIVRERRTKILIIDEAHHILLAAQGKWMREQFEAIKSLSIATSTTIVLIGTYELLTILEQSAQLIRRSKVIHLPRYRWEDPDHVASFQTALLSFQRHMPFPVEPNLVDHVSQIYLQSAGCIGILKEWLDKGVENGLKNGLETIDYDFINGFAHANKSVCRVFDEAIYGENKLADITIEELRKYVVAQTRSQKGPSPKPKRSSVATQVAKAGKKKRRPGQRNPVRDPVGVSGDLFGYGNAS